MCKVCGCDQGQKEFWETHNHGHDQDHTHSHSRDGDHEHTHTHSHGNQDHTHSHSHDGNQDHTHSHSHDGDHEHNHPNEHQFKVNLRENLLSENDTLAAKNRQFFADNNITAFNFMSSPGSGKTSLLTKILIELKKKHISVATLVGDQTTNLDSEKLKTSNTWVHQINTYSSCHLDSRNIQNVITLLPEKVQLLFIENIGNLVCPAAFDLGEQVKIALISCTEGEDKVLKYPVLFHQAHVVILTKIDLIPHLDWNTKLFKQNLQKINPAAHLFEVSSKTDQGISELIDFILKIGTRFLS